VNLYFTPAGAEFSVDWSDETWEGDAEPDALIPPGDEDPHDEPAATVSSGRALYEAHLDLIRERSATIARLHHLCGEDLKDFPQHVCLKLLENDCAKLSLYRGDCPFPKFLWSVIEHLCFDYLDWLYGKWRPCVAAQVRGPLGVAYDRLTSRDGYTPSEAFEILRTNYQFTISRDAFDDLVTNIPIRPRRRLVPDEPSEDMPSPVLPPDVQLEEETCDKTLIAVLAALEAAIEAMPNPRDRIILKMLYRDGESLATIARTLGLDHKRLFRHRDKLFAQLRETLESQRFDAHVIRELFS
jgi:RNA polymerase sigma factor (sigma-70 family)